MEYLPVTKQTDPKLIISALSKKLGESVHLSADQLGSSDHTFQIRSDMSATLDWMSRVFAPEPTRAKYARRVAERAIVLNQEGFSNILSHMELQKLDLINATISEHAEFAPPQIVLDAKADLQNTIESDKQSTGVAFLTQIGVISQNDVNVVTQIAMFREWSPDDNPYTYVTPEAAAAEEAIHLLQDIPGIMRWFAEGDGFVGDIIIESAAKYYTSMYLEAIDKVEDGSIYTGEFSSMIAAWQKVVNKFGPERAIAISFGGLISFPVLQEIIQIMHSTLED